jgi:hypothetical protein
MKMREALSKSMGESHALKKAANTRQQQIEVLSSRLVRSLEEGQQHELKLARVRRKATTRRLQNGSFNGSAVGSKVSGSSSTVLDRRAGKATRDNFYLTYGGDEGGGGGGVGGDGMPPMLGGMGGGGGGGGDTQRPTTAQFYGADGRMLPVPASSQSLPPGMYAGTGQPRF